MGSKEKGSKEKGSKEKGSKEKGSKEKSFGSMEKTGSRERTSSAEPTKKKSKKTKPKLLFIPITIWMEAVLVIFLLATLIICIRGLMDYGFTLDSIPNFILVIVLLLVSIVIVFAITTERKPFIVPLNGLIITLVVLTFFVFFYRIYVFARDGGKTSTMVASSITYAVMLGVYALAFFIIMYWKRQLKKGKGK